MSYSFNSFEEQQSIYPPIRDERAEYIFSPIISNNDQVQYSPPHIHQLTNERDSITQYSLPVSMPHNTKNIYSSQYINYDFNEQISSTVHYSPTSMLHDDNNYDCIMPTTQYSTSCSIPTQQYIDQNIDGSISQYSSQYSTFTQQFIYNSVETQQIYDKNLHQPILNLPLPHDNLCDDSNAIFRFEIPGFEIVINPSTFTNDYHFVDNSQYSSQQPTLTQHYTETQQIYDFPHDDLHANSPTYRFDIPGFNIIINPST